MDGVIRTLVGYSGGSTVDPTYHNLEYHSETIQIDFDPSQISYEALLEVFWQSHSARTEQWLPQYASNIFYADEEQRRIAEASKEREEARIGYVSTRIRPAGPFYLAEDYHQKYYLSGAPDMAEALHEIYPDPDDFPNSTVVARVNGYLAGYTTLPKLTEQLNGLELSPTDRERLLALAAKR